MQQILTIEPSATQRYVLNNTLEAAGFGVVVAEDADAAERALSARLTDLDHALEGVVLSWPDSPDEGMSRIMAMLELPDHHDLPVMVLNQAKRSGARAWVDNRNRARLLEWRHQRNAGEALKRLIGGEPLMSEDNAANDGGLSVLVVDDSPSIRLAFGDLLRLQGYRVEVVATARDALEAVGESVFDIAVVDFYLGEQTGDTLIKQLIDAAGGELACAVLTSNYADHIIQQSLAAGAVACLFKSEPGDLLLARIEGMARLLNGRAHLRDQVAAARSLAHALPHIWLHVDRDAGVIDLSKPARRFLAIEVDRQLAAGTPLHSLHSSLEGETGKQLAEAIAEGQPVEAGGWECRALADGTALVNRRDVSATGGLRASPDLHFSVLLMAIEFTGAGDQPISVAANQQLVAVLTERLQQRVIQSDRIEYLGHGLYSIVVAHRSDAAGIVAAKQLMMTVVGIGQGLGKVSLHSHAALVSQERPDPRDAETLKRARDGALKARAAGRNQLCLVDRGVVLNADSRPAS